MVKQELSKRYYNHYLKIIATPESQRQTPAPPAPEDTAPPAGADDSDTGEPATGQREFSEEDQGKPGESLSLDERFAGIAEVAPIKLKAPASPETAAEAAKKLATEQPTKRKFCFIATAAYGSFGAPEVVVLQDFRDRCLSRHFLGEKFIRAYYRVSPYLAGKISENRLLQMLTRFLLAPLVLLIKQISRRISTS